MKKKLYFAILTVLATVLIFANLSAKHRHDDDSTGGHYWRHGFEISMWGDTSVYNIELNKPFIELNYGTSMPHWNGMSRDFKPLGQIEARLGTMSSGLVDMSSNVFKTSSNYLSLSNSASDYGSKSDKEYYETKIWNLTLSDESGYGWKIGDNASISLYHGGGINWSKVEFNTPGDGALDVERINYLGNDVRFGGNFTAGARIRFFSNLALNAGYERTEIFPRHMFWYWAGSELTEGIAQGITSHFVKLVENSAPDFVPVVNVLVHSAVSYGFYELRRENMNWPIGTEQPLEFQTFKVGFTVYM